MLNLPFYIARYLNVTEITLGIQQEIDIYWLETP